MLLQNLTDQLVNGLRGYVKAVREGEVDVYFESLDCVATISRTTFAAYDPVTNANLAERIKLPLKLCYAMTIHKPQGMTLERVQVDCRRIFQPGQLGVAISRVTSVEGLRVVNFSPNALIRQPACVIDYLGNESEPLHNDLSCCHRPTPASSTSQDSGVEDTILTVAAIADTEVEAISDEEDPEFDSAIGTLLPFENVELPQDWDASQELTAWLYKSPVTKAQEELNLAIQTLLENPDAINNFAKTQYAFFIEMYGEYIKVKEGEKIPQNQITSFYQQFQIHMTSTKYKETCV